MTSGFLYYNSKLTEWMEAALGKSTALQMNISDTMEYIWLDKHRSDYLQTGRILICNVVPIRCAPPLSPAT